MLFIVSPSLPPWAKSPKPFKDKDDTVASSHLSLGGLNARPETVLLLSSRERLTDSKQRRALLLGQQWAGARAEGSGECTKRRESTGKPSELASPLPRVYRLPQMANHVGLVSIPSDSFSPSLRRLLESWFLSPVPLCSIVPFLSARPGQ